MALETVDIEEKVDSPEKLAQIQAQGIQPKHWISGPNFNKLRERLNQLVNFANKIKPDLFTPNDTDFPTTKAVKDETDKKIAKIEMSELEVGSNVDVNNYDPENKGVLGFKNPIKISGIKSAGMYDGKEIYLFNRSIGIVTILNQNTSSAVGNRIKIRGNQDLELPAGAITKLRYSSIMNCFELVDITGAEIMTHLAYAGNEQRVLTVTPSGIVFAEPMMDFQVFDDNAAGYANLSALVAAYPSSANRKKGFQVICGQMAQPTLYIKGGDGDDNWLKFVGIKVV